MGLWSLLIHLANLLAPAMAIGVLIALGAPWLAGIRPSARTITAQAAINTVAGVTASVAGLLLFGNDGKMATYAALVLATGTAQFLGLRR